MMPCVSVSAGSRCSNASVIVVATSAGAMGLWIGPPPFVSRSAAIATPARGRTFRGGAELAQLKV